MKTYEQKEDIKLFCVTARSFPEGIMEAFSTLESINSSICSRPFYGISYLDGAGQIVYKAAVPELFDGESELYGLESFMLKKGNYVTETLMDYMDRPEKIAVIFKKLLSNPLLDTRFPCIEWYRSDEELVCMVKIDKDKLVN